MYQALHDTTVGLMCTYNSGGDKVVKAHKDNSLLCKLVVSFALIWFLKDPKQLTLRLKMCFL